MKQLLRAGLFASVLFLLMSRAGAQTLGDRSVWLMSGTTETSGVDLGSVESFWHIAAAGDFDGDGHPDLVWENVETGEHYLWLMNGTTLSSIVQLPTTTTDWRVAVVGSFHTGTPAPADIVLESLLTGDRQVWLMSGITFSSSTTFATIPPEWHIAACGEFGGGHNQDLVWEDTSTGDHAVWFMNGTTQTGSNYLAYVSTDWRIAGLGSFHSGSTNDILWEDIVTGDRAVWLMSGMTVSSTPYLAYVSPDWLISTAVPLHGGSQADIVWEYVPWGDQDVDGLLDSWERANFSRTGVDPNSATTIGGVSDNVPYAIKVQLGMNSSALATVDNTIALNVTKPQ